MRDQKRISSNDLTTKGSDKPYPTPFGKLKDNHYIYLIAEYMGMTCLNMLLENQLGLKKASPTFLQSEAGELSGVIIVVL